MELLVIKTVAGYIRVKDGAYTAVGLDKASVFPFERLVQVKDQLTGVRASGFPQAVICRLTLTETLL